jgi:hypothetical protein
MAAFHEEEPDPVFPESIEENEGVMCVWSIRGVGLTVRQESTGGADTAHPPSDRRDPWARRRVDQCALFSNIGSCAGAASERLDRDDGCRRRGRGGLVFVACWNLSRSVEE